MEPLLQSNLETRIPIIVPDSRQILMRENARLVSIEADQPPETYTKHHLARLGLRTVKPLGMIEPVDGISGFALYYEVGQPMQRLRGGLDPHWRLSLFSIDRVLDQAKHFDEVDIHFIHEALKLTRKHVGRKV